MATTNLGPTNQSQLGQLLEYRLRRERTQIETTYGRRQEQEQYLYGLQSSAGELD
jgi:hypothetical protein